MKDEIDKELLVVDSYTSSDIYFLCKYVSKKISVKSRCMDEVSWLIIRHRKENLRKCSLRGLEGRNGFLFFSYPDCTKPGVLPSLDGYILLDIDGEELTSSDTAPLVVLDGTWRYAAVMHRQIPQLTGCIRRKLPSSWKTAYPRCQTQCADPERGLASIEAIYAASLITGRSVDGLLDSYYWKELFFEKNHLSPVS
jgi:pre-rRNA-processing protein TSR3